MTLKFALLSALVVLSPLLGAEEPLSTETASPTVTESATPTATETPTPEPSPTFSATPTPYVLPPSPIDAFKGSLSGSLTDALSKKPVSSATVSVKNSRGKRYEGHAENGRYLVPKLPWGTYTLTIQAEGYHKFTRPGVRLVGRRPDEINLELEPLPEPQK